MKESIEKRHVIVNLNQKLSEKEFIISKLLHMVEEAGIVTPQVFSKIKLRIYVF